MGIAVYSENVTKKSVKNRPYSHEPRRKGKLTLKI